MTTVNTKPPADSNYWKAIGSAMLSIAYRVQANDGTCTIDGKKVVGIDDSKSHQPNNLTFRVHLEDGSNVFISNKQVKACAASNVWDSNTCIVGINVTIPGFQEDEDIFSVPETVAPIFVSYKVKE